MIESTLSKAKTAADKAATESIALQTASFATKSCTRCDGKGFATIFDSARCHWNGEGKKVCFACGGAGRVLATKALVEAAKVVRAKVEIERLRAHWVATRAALVEAKALAVGGRWDAKHTVNLLEAALVRIARVGKDLASAR